MQQPVLIVGAGPSGLMLALWLTRCGVPLRIVEKNDGPGQTSRAMVVHARSLEFYRQIGLADEAVARGIVTRRLHLRDETRETAVFDFSNVGAGLSPFPFLLSLPQDENERLLGEHLKAAGVDIEWSTELTACDADGRVRLQKGAQVETLQAAFVCGCDGAHSVVRRHLGAQFHGGAYREVFYVADVRGRGVTANGDFNFCLGRRHFCGVFPIRTSGMVRLIGVVPAELGDPQSVTPEQVMPYAEKLGGVTVDEVNWFSLYHVHHRVAERFRIGRAFLVGDAAHIHSPAGGQGMNTGLGDAVNLAWKLADVLHERAAPHLLDTYEVERQAFAHELIASTDRLFRAMVGSGLGDRFTRLVLLPRLFPWLMRWNPVRHAVFRRMSQISLAYPASELSEGAAGRARGGDRLPWTGDNFNPLQSLDWQVQVYGEASGTVPVPVHAFPWSRALARAGLQRDALYLIRPDGHVALACTHADEVRHYLERLASGPPVDNQPVAKAGARSLTVLLGLGAGAVVLYLLRDRASALWRRRSKLRCSPIDAAELEARNESQPELCGRSARSDRRPV